MTARVLYALHVACSKPRTVALPVARSFSVYSGLYDKPLPPRRKIEESEIEEAFLKGSGPGGQKINKTSSAVQLKHLPTGIVVKSQETRSRDQNRKLARQILGEKLDQIEKGDESRVAIKAERAKAKKASASKKAKRKYKKLDEEKVGQDGRNGQDGSAGVDQGRVDLNDALEHSDKSKT